MALPPKTRSDARVSPAGATTSPCSPTGSCCTKRSPPPRSSRAKVSSAPSSTCSRSTRSTRETILEAARATGKVLIVHEDTLTGGLGGEIAAIIAEHAFEDLDAPIRRLAGPDIPPMPFHETMESFFMPDRAKIAAAARDLAAY